MTIDEEVAAAINDGYVTLKAICIAVGLANRTVDNALRRLAKRGVIRFDRGSHGVRPKWVRNDASPCLDEVQEK